MSKNIDENTQLILYALADVFEVSLILLDKKGNPLTDWANPILKSERNKSFDHWEYNSNELPENEAFLVTYGNNRRFFYKLCMTGSDEYILQSSDLPEKFFWTDGSLLPQEQNELQIKFKSKSPFLLNIFVFTVFDITYNYRIPNDHLNDLDIENIRRIGISLESRIIIEKQKKERNIFSLEGIPSIDKIIYKSSEGKDLNSYSTHLNSIFLQITQAAGITGAFNIMSLKGDLLLTGMGYNLICSEIIRKHKGQDCFRSDIRCLIKAVLFSNKTKYDLISYEEGCHAGFTEVFAPIFADGLIVGLVFGGQQIASEQNLNYLKNYVETLVNKPYSIPSQVKIVTSTEIDKTKRVLTGFASLIGLMFEKYCHAENSASLGRVLLELKLDDEEDSFTKVCDAVKKLLSASECSAFLISGNYLYLAATTANKLFQGSDRTRKINREEAIGIAFYEIGEGLTGSVAKNGIARFEKIASVADNWRGNINEDDGNSQIYLAPIKWEDNIYGVLRLIRPSKFGDFPIPHRSLIRGFAKELALLMRNHELNQDESVRLKEKADQLKSMLAEAAHEFRGPLSNILSLSAYVSESKHDKLRENHQAMVYEIYRAKRIMDNYISYDRLDKNKDSNDFQENNISTIIHSCVKRHQSKANERLQSIEVDYSINLLPPLVFDAIRIDQVITNLLDNAIKYGFKNTSIEVSAKEKENTITISVSDLGLGVPKELKDKIFIGYQRSVKDPKVFKPGTGLGLMISRKIARAHGGDIYVESKEFWQDKGRLNKNEGFRTKFTLSIPKTLKENVNNKTESK